MKAVGEASRVSAGDGGCTSKVRDPEYVQEVVKKCFSQLLQRYDPEMGGFSEKPKFPTPVNMNFLFRLYAEVS